MRANRFALLIVLALFSFPAATSTAAATGLHSSWARTLTGTNAEGFAATSVEQTTDGGFIVAGATVSPQFLGQTWLARLDAGGAVVWQKAYGGFNTFVGIVLIGPQAKQTPDGGFAVATNTNVSRRTAAAWIFKVDPKGNILWQQRFTGIGNASAAAIDLAADGGLLVFGHTYTTAGSIEAFALKIDPNGVVEWEKTYTGQGTIAAIFSAHETSDGGSIVSGWTGDAVVNAWLLRLDANGGIVWQKTYPLGPSGLLSVQQTVDGGFVATGGDLVLRFNPGGDLIWQKSFGGGATRAAFFSIKQTPDGGFVLAGFSGVPPANPTSLLIGLDSAGNIIWQRSFAAGVLSQALSVGLTSSGGLTVAGFDLTTTTISDAWVLKLDSKGRIHHCASFSDSSLTVADSPITQSSITGSSSDLHAGLITTTALSADTSAPSVILCGHVI